MSQIDARLIGTYLDRQPVANAYLRALLACSAPGFPLKWVARERDGELTVVAALSDGWLPGLPLAWCCVAAGDPPDEATASSVAAELQQVARGDWVLTGPCSSTLPLALAVQPAAALEPQPFSLQVRHPSSAIPELRAGVRRATEADLPRLMAFYRRWDRGLDENTRLRRWTLVPRRGWIAEQAGEIVAAAMTHIEGPEVAMVGGIFTTPEHRGEGWATELSAALCFDLELDGLTPCLYYEVANGAAHRVYRRLGFTPVTEWFNALIFRRDPTG